VIDYSSERPVLPQNNGEEIGRGSSPVQPPARESPSRRTLLYADEF
jgi:hypothetical protein